MKNLNDVINGIKIAIRMAIVGKSFNYKGKNKRILAFDSFWGPGFEFAEEFELATVASEGPKNIDVKFSCWTTQEIDDNSSRKVNLSGRYGPIKISFTNDEYEIDTSKARFHRIEVE